MLLVYCSGLNHSQWFQIPSTAMVLHTSTRSQNDVGNPLPTLDPPYTNTKLALYQAQMLRPPYSVPPLTGASLGDFLQVPVQQLRKLATAKVCLGPSFLQLLSTML